jgi:hypothetical protein
MSYDSDATFDKRNNYLREDTAMDEAKQWLTSNNIYHKVIGFDSIGDKVPSELWWKVGDFLRSMPDILVIGRHSNFLEVKGCRNVLRIKLSDLMNYLKWNEIEELHFFIHSTTENSNFLMTIDDLITCLSDSKWKIKKYKDNNKKYIALPVESLHGWEVT